MMRIRTLLSIHLINYIHNHYTKSGDNLYVPFTRTSFSIDSLREDKGTVSGIQCTFQSKLTSGALV